MLAAVLAFAGVAAVINVTPGLDTMMVLRASVSGGRLAGFVGGLGINTGCLAWGLAAAAGASELLIASQTAYTALRIVGAAYLTWMGCRALWRSRRRASEDAAAPARAANERNKPSAAMGSPENATIGRPENVAPRRLAAFRSGLFTNLLNPKAGVFYMSLLPQFIPRGAPVFSTAILLTSIDVAELLIWFCVLSTAASSLTCRINQASFRRRMEQLTGIVFIGFAVDLIVDRSI
jgi:threonine/homoserine/homoserine lactone efflux protein